MILAYELSKLCVPILKSSSEETAGHIPDICHFVMCIIWAMDYWYIFAGYDGKKISV